MGFLCEPAPHNYLSKAFQKKKKSAVLAHVLIFWTPGKEALLAFPPTPVLKVMFIRHASNYAMTQAGSGVSQVQT